MFDAYDLFQSIDVIVDSRLQALKLDRTLVCQISHDSLKAYGEYEVTYNATRFTAYSDKDDYAVGDTVYVGVPQDNYNDAFIISKKLSDAVVNNKSNPFEDFVQMTEYKADTKMDIVANETVYEALGAPLIKWSISDPEPYANMGLSFQVSSKLPDDCKYGFIIQVKTEEVLNDKQTYNKVHIFTFASNEFIGKATTFLGEFSQKKLIDISKLKNIVEVKIYLDIDNIENITAEHYLYFKELAVSFGYQKSAYEEDSVYVYTNAINTYEYSTEVDASPPTYDIFIRWLYKNSLGELIAITAKNPEDMPDNTSIKWYQLEGKSWRELTTERNKIHIVATPSKYKAVENYKCIIEYELFGQDLPAEHESNILVLTNNTEGFKDIVENDSFELTTSKKDFSSYYNFDGSIADYSMSEETRTVTAAFNIANGPWESGGDDIAIFLTWKVPRVSSMISIDDEVFTDEGEYYILKEEIELPSARNNYANLKTVNGNQIIKNMIYQIKDFYCPSDINNFIECDISVIKITSQELLQQDSKRLSLDFRRPGVCEKDNILILEMFDASYKRIRAIQPNQTVSISAKLYDNNGAELKIVKPIEWSWYSPNNLDEDKMWITKKQNGNEGCFLTSKSESDISKDPNGNLRQNYNDMAYILCGKYITESSTGKREVVGYLPIAINPIGAIKYLSGPTQIVYSSSGGNPSYYNGRYKLIQNSSYEMYNAVYNVHSPIGPKTNGINNTLYPTIATIDDENWLIPKTTYIKEANTNCCLVVTNTTGILCWIQPLLMYQTNSFSSFVNEWDGKMKIDEENNVAMMARLGAGKKNEDGTYSGVLLGDWVPEIEDGSWTGTGIFGYDHGQAAYGLREDGTAFIGKSGAGRINFNGNEGLIYSDNFDGTIYGVQSNPVLLNEAANITDFLDLTNFECKNTPNLSRIIIDRTYFNQAGDYGQINLTIPCNNPDYQQDYAFIKYGEKILVSYTLYFTSLKFTGVTDENQVDRTSALHVTCADTYAVTEVGQGTTGPELDNDQFWSGQVYSRSKIYVKSEIYLEPPYGKTEEEIANIKIDKVTIPLVTVTLLAGESSDTSLSIKRSCAFEINDLQIYKVAAEDSDIRSGNVPRDVQYDDLFAYYYGNSGTYINLKNGTLITNNGIFRGKLVAQELEVENTVTIGNLETGKYIILDPAEGVSLGAKSVVGGAPNLNIVYMASADTDTIRGTIEPNQIIITGSGSPYMGYIGFKDGGNTKFASFYLNDIQSK